MSLETCAIHNASFSLQCFHYNRFLSLCKHFYSILEAGMGCIGCPHSQMESIEEGAIGHGIDPDLLVEKLNATVQAVLNA